MRRDLQQRLDKAVEVNSMGVGIQVGVPASDLAFPDHTVVVFDDESGISLEDAQKAVQWVRDVISGKTDISGGIPQDVIDLFAAGSGDTAFCLWLSSHVPAADLVNLLNWIDLTLNNLSLLHGDESEAARCFAKQYSDLLDGMAGAWSKAVNSLPPDSTQRTSLVEGFASVFRSCPPHDQNGALLSIFIGRGDWPSDFLSAMKVAIEQTEGELGAHWWAPYWDDDGAFPRRIVDPGRAGFDGEPLIITDAMYGVWMAAALHNPTWFIDQYCGHDTVQVDWTTPGYHGSAFDPNMPVHSQVDQAIYDLFHSRGFDAASFQAFIAAAGMADATILSGGIPKGWMSISAQIGAIIAQMDADAAAEAAKPWWERYKHEIVGLAGLLAGVAALFATGPLAAGLMVASFITVGVDISLFILDGDWKAALLTAGMLVIPFVINGVVKFVRFTAAMIKGMSVLEVAGKRFVWIGGKLTQISPEEWAALGAGKRVPIGGKQFLQLDGKLVEVSNEQWAALSRGGRVKIGNEWYVIVDGQPVRLKAGEIAGFGKDNGLPPSRTNQNNSASAGNKPPTQTKTNTSSSKTSNTPKSGASPNPKQTSPVPPKDNIRRLGNFAERQGDIVASDGSSLKPGEVHITKRGYDITSATPEQIAQLDALAAAPDSPIMKIGETYYLKDTINVDFDMDGYFARSGINPNAQWQPGITFRQEFERQLQLQQNGLNNLTVREWRHNLRDFAVHKRDNTGQVAARAAAGGKSGDGTAILHGPDQAVGGRPDAYDGLGSGRINSTIGSQWSGDRADDLFNGVVKASVHVDRDLLRFVHMNVRLNP